ncbi:MAG: helix-turn-helix transcriptional regulator [Erysipelotrichaceae bacterium]|jgi:transcriptional regulator with XRE-family HTH domain|nr:helix-turn-helix transcriptional regulator [Erysipelotrichaceae bacterium]MEE3424403.1 helix-turn-helix transcriptional regulator [Erysipelotrichaceae bacterium]
MKQMGNKIALRRKDLGLTQNEFAEKLSVTRQTISRWEAGTVLPDIDKISDIASILQVSCDYLLKDEIEEDTISTAFAPGKLLSSLLNKKVKLNFFDDEGDIELFNKECEILSFEGNWIKVIAQNKKETIEKLIPLSSVQSFEILPEEKQ